jgi:cell fate regulator YaaT (PSP1 superfamily)
MTQTVRVRLRKPSRVFTFIARDIALGRNETCVVRTDRGLEYGICVMPGDDATPEDEERHKMTVVRRASDHDDLTYRQIKSDEERAKDLCKRKIRERKLAMKLVECEYSFDRKKVIFYFTADDRVDFRDLVRDLAREFKARIELRHIQVRDEAKIVGGIGSCGRELCCTTWMREFMPISMKMAKKQNLSLNPSKISGQCGRLLCCLSYENDMYQRERRPSGPPAGADLGALREDMEEHQSQAIDALKSSTLADVLTEEPEVIAVEERARPGEFAAPEIPIGEDADDGGDETPSRGPSQQRPAGERPEGRRRRRRGRRGGGGPNRGPGGGSGGSPSNAS